MKMCRVPSVNICRKKKKGVFISNAEKKITCPVTCGRYLNRSSTSNKFYGPYMQQTLHHTGPGLSISIKIQGSPSLNPVVLKLPCPSESSGRHIQTKFLGLTFRVSG